MFSSTMVRPKLQTAVLKWFVDEEFSFEQETALANSGAALIPAGLLDIGLIVGRITASGKVVPLNLAAADGSQNAMGVVVRQATVPAASDAPVVLVERLAVLLSDGLIFPAGATNPQKAAIRAQLAAIGLIVRDS